MPQSSVRPSPLSQPPTFSFEGISFGYDGGEPLLRSLSLDIQERELFGLHGPNGSGKTTLFRIGSGLLRPDQGVVRIQGHEIHEAPREVRRRCAFVPSDNLLYPDASALENLNLFALLWEVPSREARERAHGLLRDSGLWEVRNQWIRGFSRGMKQRLTICAALISDPRFLLMDEPFTGLDDAGAAWVKTRLRQLAERGGSALLTNASEHHLTGAVDRMGSLRDGRIVMDSRA